MQKIKYLILLFLTCFLSIVQAQTVLDEVIWIVGDEAILKSEVERRIIQAKYERVEIPGDPYCTIPEQLAVRKLFFHQAQLDSVQANEGMVVSQVDQRVDQIIAEIGSQEKLEEYYKKNIRQIKEELKDQAREQMIIQQVQRDIVGDLKITPADVRKFYSNLDDDEIPVIPAKVEVQLLSVEPPYSTQDIEDIKEKLRGFKERIESGEASFSMLATLYSDDIESAKQGGELGFMGKGQLVAEYANEAFNLTDPNKVSRIVQSEFGYHIIQLIERRGDKANTRHILLKPRVSFEQQKKAVAALDSIGDLIRAGKISFEDAVMVFSDDKNTRMNSGLMVNPYDGTSQFEYQHLPQEVSKTVYNMNINEISKPFTMINQSGREVCAVIKLKSKTAQHKANMEDDYQLLKSFVQNKKNAEIVDDWIKEKQKETFVQIKSDWQNCDFQYPNWINK